MAHNFYRAHQGGGFPVSLRAEALSLGHKPLHCYPWKLFKVMQVFKRARERMRSGFMEKMSYAEFNSRCISQ